MADERVSPPHLVKVFPPNPQSGSEMQLWAAMTSADEAVQSVLDQLGPGWRAELILGGVTKEQAARVKLRHGEVGEYTFSV